MISKRIATGCIAAVLAAAPVSRALAGDGLLGGIVGGVIGGIIVNEANKNHRGSGGTGASSVTRADNRSVQTALNYFGFAVGTPDGSLGPRSRSAIADYQITLGYPGTGQLTAFEHDLLLNSYNRAVAGGALTMQQAATNPLGMRGLLISYRDEMAGAMPGAPAMGGGTVAQGPAVTADSSTSMASSPAGGMAGAGAPPAGAGGGLPAFTDAGAGGPDTSTGGSALPSFFGGTVTQASLASHCNKISLVTNTNGGFVTSATMTDANFALNEQFCLARTYAISQGEDLAAHVQGFTPQQINQQCESFGPAMKDEIAALSLKPRDEVLSQVSSFALKSGMAPAQLAATAKICLSVGYRTDNMDVAIASALLLSALGDKAYGELLGHHLAEGFGAAQRPDLALAWYDMALDALAAGTSPVFVPGQPDRTMLLKKAAYTVGGKSDQASSLPATVPAALPSFLAPAPGAGATATSAPAKP